MIIADLISNITDVRDSHDGDATAHADDRAAILWLVRARAAAIALCRVGLSLAALSTTTK